jgi:hypothetical protein
MFKRKETTRNQKLYSVYDSVAETWLKPFPMRNKGEAIRGFTQAVNDPQTNLYQHPEDYTLFEIGEWDDEKGVILMYDAKLSCGVAIEYRNNTQDPRQDPHSDPRMESPQKIMEITKETKENQGDQPNVQ